MAHELVDTCMLEHSNHCPRPLDEESCLFQHILHQGYQPRSRSLPFTWVLHPHWVEHQVHGQYGKIFAISGQASCLLVILLVHALRWEAMCSVCI